MAKKPAPPIKSQPPPSELYDGSEHHAAYSEHSNILRTWLVAYGVGGPVLILSQDTLWAVIAKSGNLRAIAGWFLLGVAVQVALAAVNKAVMWACYYGAENARFKTTIRFKASDWLSRQFWIDLLADFIAIGSFLWATYLCFISLAHKFGT